MSLSVIIFIFPPLCGFINSVVPKRFNIVGNPKWMMDWTVDTILELQQKIEIRDSKSNEQ